MQMNFVKEQLAEAENFNYLTPESLQSGPFSRTNDGKTVCICKPITISLPRSFA
jgi:hypothetical protein